MILLPCVRFDASRIKTAKALWIAPCDYGEAPDHARFIADYAYAVPDSPSFGDVEFDKTDTISLDAERYGGSGTGTHGGGARVGNLGDAQLKGIGQNPLACASDGTLNGAFHSYGGFSLADCICETINSVVLENVLPFGTVRPRGIILISPIAAFHPKRADAQRAPAVILVRDRATRPAHFFRNPNFVVPGRIILDTGNDVTRLRNANLALRQHCSGDEGVMRFLADFLRRCARQFGWARMLGVNHGSISPSNITCDGRWIDLMGSSFLPGNLDYAPAPWVCSFHEEMRAPISIAREWAYTYSKYAGVELDFAALADFYDKALDGAQIMATLALFGATPSSNQGAAKIGRLLRDRILSCRKVSSDLTDELPQPIAPGEDPVLQTLERLVTEPPEDDRCEQAPFASLVSGCRNDCFSDGLTATALAVHCALVCFRKLVFASFFYRGRLAGIADVISGNQAYDDVAAVIATFGDVAKWVFGQTADSNLIIRCAGFSMSMDARTNIVIDDRGGRTTLRGSRRFDEACLYLESASLTSAPAQHGCPPVEAYDFAGRAAYVLRVLQKVERAWR